jgi:DNA mismatch repair protein MutL
MQPQFADSASPATEAVDAGPGPADIVQLPPSVVNKIAAGEVIERPASVVKELLENSLDAGATRVDVSVGRGGTEWIAVTDNGCGIRPQQLPLAVASHATSKIRHADDLFRVATLGFRGEALASIAEVSRLVLRSRSAGSLEGAEVTVDAGRRSEVAPVGCPQGTSVIVRDLFFNTPVRRKFLKALATELGHVTEVFTRLALAHPAVHFTLTHNQKAIYDLPPVSGRRDRIGAFFGPEMVDHLIAVESRDEQVRLWGDVGDPSQTRPNPRFQYLFLNGRFIRDRSLSHALQEAYRGLVMTGRYPMCFLSIDMPAHLVDVNVHPTKLEVRFQDGGRLYSQILGTLRTRFLTTDLTARMAAPPPSPDVEPSDFDRRKQELVEWARSAAAAWEVGAPPRQSFGSAPADGPPVVEVPRGQTPLSFHSVPAAETLPALTPPIEPPANEPARRPPAERARIDEPHPPVPPALQIHDRYLVAQSDDGLLVIDQHALHERILYERIKARILEGNLETQGLLVPEPVDLGPGEAAAVLAQSEVLARLGLRVESFGGDTVLVTGYPAIMGSLSPADLLRSVADQVLAGGKSLDKAHLLEGLLATMACKAAVKAGDRLAPQEIQALLADRHLVNDSHHCPHGRPTALRFTREELDRQFKRT